MGHESKYAFDSEALERAAKAAKDLEKSPHAKEVLELSRAQERTKQMEYEKQIKEMQAYQEELKQNSALKLAEEKRKLLDEETRHNNEVSCDSEPWWLLSHETQSYYDYGSQS